MTSQFRVRIAFNDHISHLINVRAQTKIEAIDKAYYHRLVENCGWVVIPKSVRGVNV